MSHAKDFVQDDGSPEAGSEENELEEKRECLLCGLVPDSIICLSCGHNIDIPCAARVMIQAQEAGEAEEGDISQIKCALCGEVTLLSPEVQEAIIQYDGEEEGGYEEAYENDQEPEVEQAEEEFYEQNDNHIAIPQPAKKEHEMKIPKASFEGNRSSKEDASRHHSVKKKSVR
jgi:hypothetical protein